jgi:5'-nucleotidase
VPNVATPRGVECKFLLTNDDGIAAPGLHALEQAASQLGDPVVLAPVDILSGCSHRVTTNQPIRVRQEGPARYAVAGTPADCVRVGLHGFAPGTAWVLSGINHGGNLGADVHYSGTVAAVREAVLHGWPGIAVSQYHKRGDPLDWQRAADWLVPVLRQLLELPWTPGTFWNVNLPHLPPGAPSPHIVFCPLDVTALPLSFKQESELLHYNGDYHQRQRRPGTDVDVCFSGRIAVTRLTLGDQ